MTMLRGLLPVVFVLLEMGAMALGDPPPAPRLGLVLQVPPATSVDSVAVSRDGTLVASAAGEGGVRLYDAKTGAMLRTIGAAGDRSVVFSPDGKTLAAAGFHMDKLVGLWDVRSGERLRTFVGQTEWEADATAISPDGKWLASSATDKQVLVWEIATGKLRLQLKDQPFRVTALVFSPDSATLAGGGGDKSVRLWDCATGELRRTLAGHREWVCTLAFSADGQTIASGGCDWGFHRGHDWPRPAGRGPERCEWRLWEVGSGKLLRSASDAGRMLSLALSSSGKSLACGIGTEVRLYDLSSDASGKVVTRHDGDVTSVAFTPDDGAVVSSSHDQTVRRTRLRDGRMEWEAPGSLEQVNSISLSADASLLATGSSDHRFARGRLAAGAKPIGGGAVRLWDARTGRLVRRFGSPAEQSMAVALSADGRRLASGGASAKGQGVSHVWNSQTGESLWSMDDHASEVLAVAFSPDGTRLATASADGTVKLRDSATGEVQLTGEGHRRGGTSLAFSGDGAKLFCAEGYGGAKVWDTATGRLAHTYEAASSQAESFTIDRLMSSIGVARGGEILATCASSVNNEFVDPVRLWNTRTTALERNFSVEKIQGRPMAISPDGALVATGGKSVKLWDVRTGQRVRELFGQLKRTQSIVFSSDGRMIVSGGSYGTTNLWEVATGRLMVTLFAFPEGRDGTGKEAWLAYHPEGFYDGSPGIDRYLSWRVGDRLLTPETVGQPLHQPGEIEASLRPGPLRPVSASR